MDMSLAKNFISSINSLEIISANSLLIRIIQDSNLFFLFFFWTLHQPWIRYFFPLVLRETLAFLIIGFICWIEKNKIKKPEIKNKNKKQHNNSIVLLKINDFCQLKCQSFIFSTLIWRKKATKKNSWIGF